MCMKHGRRLLNCAITMFIAPGLSKILEFTGSRLIDIRIMMSFAAMCAYAYVLGNTQWRLLRQEHRTKTN